MNSDSPRSAWLASLLRARGILQSGAVRPVTTELDPDARRYLDKLILELLPMLGSDRAPAN